MNTKITDSNGLRDRKEVFRFVKKKKRNEKNSSCNDFRGENKSGTRWMKDEHLNQSRDNYATINAIDFFLL